MENFMSFGLQEPLLQSIINMRFTKPTPIQAETIPPALLGRDVMGSAQTGTGKTAAYSIPLVSYLLNSPQKSALVLTPTRELALQVFTTITQLLGKKSDIKSAFLIGGDSMGKQLAQLKLRPRLIVGTPGRVNDHLARGTLNLSQADFLVLDETDRMLDMGFMVQLQKIFKYLPLKRQTLMFSATMNTDIVKIAENYLKDAVKVSIGSTSRPVEKIVQEVVRTSDLEKYDILLDKLNKTNGSFIVFVKTKFATEKLAVRLRGSGHSADAIHGDLRQRNRERVIMAFRNQKHRILVATDVAARGLDIPHIEYVVNYDLPQSPEDYIHRIGRTGRNGASGIAVSFVTSGDGIKWRNICKLIKLEVGDIPKGPASSSNKNSKDGMRHKRKDYKGQKESKFGRNNSRNSNRKFNKPKTAA